MADNNEICSVRPFPVFVCHHQRRVDALEEDVGELRSENTTLKEDVGELRSENTTLKAKVNDLEAEVKGLHEKVDNLIQASQRSH